MLESDVQKNVGRRLLVDSGSAVTAVPWSFGEHRDTLFTGEDKLVSVTGDPIKHWGEACY